MGKLRLLLTADYEVFGNGTGCVDRCMIDPTNAMTAVANEFGQRITLFVDLCEYWAFREVEDSGQFEDGYKPATAIENQLRALVKAGHDVQLHFHPQWLEYSFNSKSSWNLNYDWWQLPKVPGGLGSKDDPKSLIGLFTKGVQTLESIIQPAVPEYRCKAFRAGAWCIQPEQDVLIAMNIAGIKFDSTVAPGAKYNNNLTRYDFTQAPRTSPRWQVEGSITKPTADGPITEVPIFSTVMGTSMRLSLLWKKRQKGLTNKAPGCVGAPADATVQAAIKPGKLEKILTKVQPDVRMFDFCTATFEEMRFYALAAKRTYSKALAKSDVPVVAIGHPKNFDNAAELRQFLEWVQQQDWIEFDALSETSFWQS